MLELLHCNQPTRQLPSSINVSNKLFIPRRPKSICFADRAFSHADPVIWNSLPPRLTTDLSRDISVFRCELKTHFTVNRLQTDRAACPRLRFVVFAIDIYMARYQLCNDNDNNDNKSA